MIKSIIGAVIVVAISMTTMQTAYATNGENHGQSKKHESTGNANKEKGSDHGKNDQHHSKDKQHEDSRSHDKPSTVAPEHKSDEVTYTTPEKQQTKKKHIAVTICHKTGSATNPYVRISPDDDSITKQGHGVHQDHGDIIPPFTDDKGHAYPGLNWDEAGKSIWNNDCKPVKDKAPVIVTPVEKETTPTKPVEKTPVVTEEAAKEKKNENTAPVADVLPRTGGIHASLTALIGLLLAGLTTAASYIARDRLFIK